MYCSNRPKQKGYTVEELFPEELFPTGNKQKGMYGYDLCIRRVETNPRFVREEGLVNKSGSEVTSFLCTMFSTCNSFKRKKHTLS